MRALEEKMGVPNARLAQKPKLNEKNIPYLEAFYILNSSRTSSYNGLEPLRPVDIKAFIDLKGFKTNTLAFKYFKFITAADNKFMSLYRDKVEKDSKRRQSKASKGKT